MKIPVWFVAFLVAVGVCLGWVIWGQGGPPPPGKPVEIHHHDTTLRVDTFQVAPPALLAELKRIRGVVRGFLENPQDTTTDSCIFYLVQALKALDSVQAALALPPEVRLTLQDSLLSKFPIAAFWVGVNYVAEGDTAHTGWHYRLHPARLPPKSRLGAVFGYGEGSGALAGLQIRLDQSKAIQAVKTERGWQGGLVWWLF